MIRRTLLPFLALGLFSGTPLLPSQHHGDHGHSQVPSWTHKHVANLANRFVASLDETQKQAALFPLKDEERKNWHYVPFERKGLAMKALGPQQTRLGHSLLNGILSQRGYEKTLEIIMLEQVLAELENNPEHRDAGKYYFLIFGQPSAEGPWGLRFEGHHLSLNWTFAAGQVESTPSFFGANPGKVADGPLAGLRALAAEEEHARRFLMALSEEERTRAIITDKAPRDILSKQLQTAKRLPDEGLLVGDLDQEKRQLLERVVLLYLGRNTGAVARHDLAQLSAGGWTDVRFAWAGSIKKGEGHYYRIQGKDILIEFANTQNGAAHPHAVYRNLNDDFGDDALRRHFAEHHGDHDEGHHEHAQHEEEKK